MALRLTWTDSFKVPGTGGRIDFVFVSLGIVVHRHAALSESWGGLLPSDHLPVFASLNKADVAGVELVRPDRII
jgi:endonuclease/exonuclease/phosphatase family metal-dependent hydrolase